MIVFEKFSLKSSFFRNTLMLTMGTAIAQFFPLLFYPILTRIYAPEDFGILATITSLSSIIAVIATGKYDNAILISKSVTESANVSALAFLLSIVIVLFSIPVLFVLYQLNTFPGINAFWLISIAPLLALLISIYTIYNEWCVRNKMFVNLSSNKIMNAFATTFAKLALGYFPSFPSGLVFGDLFGRIASSLTCCIHLYSSDRKAIKLLSLQRMKIVCIKYKECPQYILPAQLVNVFGAQVPIFLLAYYFDVKVVGYYSMSVLVLSIPMSVIGIAVRDVFRQRANNEFKLLNNCTSIYKKAVIPMAFISVILCLISMVVLPYLFEIVLGDNWTVAGEYSVLLCPMIFISLVNETVSAVWIITNKIREGFYWQILYFVLTVVPLTFGGYYLRNIELTLIIFSICRVIAYIINICFTYRYSKGVN